MTFDEYLNQPCDAAEDEGCDRTADHNVQGHPKGYHKVCGAHIGNAAHVFCRND